MSEALPETTRPRGAFGLRAALAVLGGVLLMALMGMTVTDVIGRYVFNAPLRGATELTELLLAAVVFLGLPAVALADEHVTVDLVTDRMPAAIKPWRGAATGLFSAVVLAVVAWRVWVYAAQIGGYGGTTTTLAIPIAPLGYFCAVCTGLGSLLTALVPAHALIAHRKEH
ncbi:TRAP transporter small permease [Salipiger bermudensis]|uniref:TRAP transporter small permease n=1 Tax=Salipiger bermudensis TaxID=344736 RepID=UPI001CD439CD|nr:TRAP transporter small permease [Salipiger bermudensis]MCA0961229.1 TRAP transporter small permease [Salipiger bermudensis]